MGGGTFWAQVIVKNL